MWEDKIYIENKLIWYSALVLLEQGRNTGTQETIAIGYIVRCNLLQPIFLAFKEYCEVRKRFTISFSKSTRSNWYKSFACWYYIFTCWVFRCGAIFWYRYCYFAVRYTVNPKMCWGYTISVFLLRCCEYQKEKSCCVGWPQPCRISHSCI